MLRTALVALVGLAALPLLVTTAGAASAAAETEDILALWKAVSVPPAPEAKAVKLDPGTTALLVLDLQSGTCNAEVRPRCVASVPKVGALLRRARSRGVFVAYSLTRTGKPADIPAELAPGPQDPVVQSGVDKFFRTDLEEILSKRGIKTAIVVGTAAHGAVLHTATAAALRGLDVVVPVEGLSAESLYAEQYTVWHLLNSPGARGKATITRMELISFGE